MNEKTNISPNIEDTIESIVTEDFLKLTGFIFAYDSSGYNTKLFSNFLWISYDISIWYQDFLSQSYSSLKAKKQDFLQIQKALKNIDNCDTLWEKCQYYALNFEKIMYFFDLLELYIPIEARKIDIYSKQVWASSQEIREIEALEEKIYGKKISDQPKYALVATKQIRRRYGENEKLLSKEEGIFIEKILSSLEQEFSNTVSSKWENNNIHLEDPLLGIKELDKSILDKEIPQEKYIKIFELCIEILAIPSAWVNLKENISNVSVSYNGINIPKNHPSYKTLTVKRIIELISHELERHMIGNVNNKKLIGTFKSLSYLWQEEWMAHVIEKLSMGNSLDNIPVNRYLPRMLVWELYNGPTFKRFLGIMNKLDGENMDIDSFFVRFKRWKDEELPWVNPKEKLYGIGALEIIDRIKSGENPLGMFLAKNGKDEQKIINTIVGKTDDNEITPQMLEAQEITLPLMLWDLIRYKLLCPVEDREFNYWGFLKYFRDRYGEMFEHFWINYRDFILWHILEHRKKNARKVQEIVDIIHQ